MKTHLLASLLFLALVSLLPAAVQQAVRLPCPGTVAPGMTNLSPGINGGVALDERLPFMVWVGGFLKVDAPGSTGGLVRVNLVVSPDGTNWTTAALSNIRLTASSVTNSAMVYDFFQLGAVKRIAVGAITNASGGTITNLDLKLTYPTP